MRNVECLWCGEALQDGREESGYTGEGPDWCADGDFGCDSSPDSGEECTGSHTPNVVATWDGHLVRVKLTGAPTHRTRREDGMSLLTGVTVPGLVGHLTTKNDTAHGDNLPVPAGYGPTR